MNEMGKKNDINIYGVFNLFLKNLILIIFLYPHYYLNPNFHFVTSCRFVNNLLKLKSFKLGILTPIMRIKKNN